MAISKRVVECLAALSCLTLVSCSAQPSGQDSCVRRYSDESIRHMMTSELGLTDGYEININWSQCKYHILIFTPQRAPDSEILVTLDASGRIIDGPR